MAFNPTEHLINLKGKQYLQVMHRLVWFREDKPLWNIDTQIIEHDNDSAVFLCKIYDENGVQKASGHGSESIKDFRDYLEKAETKAIGRALAMLGYGTQFAPELDECDRIVDSPVEPRKTAPAPNKAASAPKGNAVYLCMECGEKITEANTTKTKNGKPCTVDKHVSRCIEVFGTPLCSSCIEKRQKA